MITSTIAVNGAYYQGEDTDSEIAVNLGAGGWHVPNVGTVGALKFGSVPKQIGGKRNLRSELDRILSRIESGHLDAETIVIHISK